MASKKNPRKKPKTKTTKTEQPCDPDLDLSDVVAKRQPLWGIREWYTPSDEGGVPHELLPVPPGATAEEIQKDFALYTPALLYLYGGFSDKLFWDFLQQYDGAISAKLYHWATKQPVFRAANASEDPWTRYIFAVNRMFWSHLQEFMLSVAVCETREQLLVRVGMQEMEIADPFVDHSPTKDPTLTTITVFGVNSTTGAVAFEPGTHPFTDPPRVAFHEPQHEHMVYSQAFFAGRNPVDAVMKWEAEREKKRKNDAIDDA